MKRREISELDQIIIDYIEKHPGSTQGDVYKHMIGYGYRSRPYIRDIIIRLEAIGKIKDDRSGRAAALSIK